MVSISMDDGIYPWDDDGNADGWMMNYKLLVVVYLCEFSVMMVSFQGWL